MGRRGLCLFCVALLLILPFVTGCDTPDAPGLVVEVLDVGQSDCTLVTVGDMVLMIDTGTVTERHTLQNALRKRGIKHIDYLLLTHPHEDHIGNARMVVETYTVGSLLVSPVECEELDWRLVAEAAERTHVPIRPVASGMTFPLGDATVEILLAVDHAEDLNNASVVLTVTFGETRFLFTGDNETEGETLLLSNVAPERLDCDFLKAGHHGSAKSTGEALLAAAHPAHVAFSCGENNGYGFPADAVLKRLRKMGIEWHRTDTEGDLRYVSDGETIWFEK
ncbi:MAG: MBL fold metallo-hydrolase [Clostridia bacterium]|nr:MBL fold metallo-hydrolase [Clostridia bacterium]